MLLKGKTNKNNSIKHMKLTRTQREKVTALLLVLPALVFLIGLIAYPLIQVLFDGFQFKNLVNVNVSGFAGLDNFKEVILNEHFFKALKNTIIWTVFSVLGEYILGMFTAILLNQKVKGIGIFRVLVIIPWLVPIIVAGMTWSWMLNPDYGIVNFLMIKTGIIETAIYWLGEQNTALFTIVIVNIWRSFPFFTISILAALQAIPFDISEAASIDGAGIISRFFKITLPQLKSVSIALITIHVIWTAINFDFIWIMTQGGPYYSTETLPLMIYRYAMKEYNIGAASALASMIMMVMTVIFVFYYAQKSKMESND